MGKDIKDEDVEPILTGYIEIGLCDDGICRSNNDFDVSNDS